MVQIFPNMQHCWKRATSSLPRFQSLFQISALFIWIKKYFPFIENSIFYSVVCQRKTFKTSALDDSCNSRPQEIQGFKCPVIYQIAILLLVDNATSTSLHDFPKPEYSAWQHTFHQHINVYQCCLRHNNHP